MNEWKKIIEKTWDNRDLLKKTQTIKCVKKIIEEVDKGRL